MNDISLQARDEIVKLHNGIMSSARRSVQDAIKIGEIIAEQKEHLGHGQFLPWIASLPFSDKTSEKYMALFKYSNKIEASSNLQEAYNQIESIEAQEKRTEEERKRDMIKAYERTGKKPDGWTRDCDYAYKKKKEEDAAYENRKREAFKSHNTKNKDDEEYEMLSSVLQSATENMIKNEKARATWKDKIRVSDGGRQDPFIDAIIDYLDTLSDDNRRIEACTNIIKVCKNISVELQRKAI
jgi:hypothetical protein